MGHVRTRERQSHRVIRRKLLTSVVGRIVFGGAVAVPAATVPFAAYAQAASARTYAIPAGTLEDNLSRFGRDAGIMLSFKPEVTAGRQSNGLHGNYSARGGLDALLANTGLMATEPTPGTYLVAGPAGGEGGADGAVMLPVTTVTASADALPAPYAGGQVARGGGLGMLGTANVMDVPFSTTNYTSAILEDTQARSLADVVVNEASVRTLTSTGGFGEDFHCLLYTSDAADEL